MATIDDLRGLLPEDKFPTIDRVEDKFLVAYRTRTIEISVQAIDEYLVIRPDIEIPEQTSVFYPGHYEQLVERIGSGRFALGFTPLRDPNQRIQLKRHDGALTVEVSVVSLPFALAMLSDFNNTFGRRMPYLGILGEGENHSFRHVFRRFLTVKVDAIGDSTMFLVPDELKSVAEAGLFNLAYGGTALLSLSRSWDRGTLRLRRGGIQDVQFPLRTYKSDLVSYYQLGISSDSLLLAYLAFYKILEYFFSSVTEQGLQKRLVEKLVAPEFSHTKVSQLRQLTSLIRKYDQRMEEDKMLTAVIEHFFPADEIKDWVVAYEANKQGYYTRPQKILEQTHTLDLSADQLAPSLAKRIHHLRNALVHSKEGELASFIPYSEHESVLVAEIPIVQFLAEQLVLKSGVDIE